MELPTCNVSKARPRLGPSHVHNNPIDIRIRPPIPTTPATLTRKPDRSSRLQLTCSAVTIYHTSPYQPATRLSPLIADTPLSCLFSLFSFLLDVTLHSSLACYLTSRTSDSERPFSVSKRPATSNWQLLSDRITTLTHTIHTLHYICLRQRSFGRNLET